tara:strand:- start:457 stop:576 length:120 start_codon:yes stop_codon:yes gene_type:complete
MEVRETLRLLLSFYGRVVGMKEMIIQVREMGWEHVQVPR